MTNKLYDGVLLLVTVPSGKVAGDPVVVNGRPGVCVTSRNATTGKATVEFQPLAIYNLSVKGVNDAGNSAVAAGEKLYLDADDAFLSKKAAGNQLFGLALAAVESGATTTIEVAVLPPLPGLTAPVAAPAPTQDSLTDSTGGTPGTTLAAAAAPTSHTITDGSTGTPSTSAIAEITQAGNAGSADIAPTKNAIATLAAELVLVKADLATARGEQADLVASLAAQLAKVKVDLAALVTAQKTAGVLSA